MGNLRLLCSVLFSLLTILPTGCGESSGDRSMSGEKPPEAHVASYQETAEAAAAGHAIFESQACIRCHKPEGLPGIGPSLYDTEWRYGGEPEQIFESILNGRPGGMAPYNGRLSHQEIWYLVAYIRSLSAE